MKRICIILVILAGVIAATTCMARDVTLQWDANEEQDVAGYTVYRAERQGDKTLAWEKVSDVETTTYTDTVDGGKNWAWLVTTRDSAGNESFVSNMVELYDRTPPAAAQNLRKSE